VDLPLHARNEGVGGTRVGSLKSGRSRRAEKQGLQSEKEAHTGSYLPPRAPLPNRGPGASETVRTRSPAKRSWLSNGVSRSPSHLSFPPPPPPKRLSSARATRNCRCASRWATSTAPPPLSRASPASKPWSKRHCRPPSLLLQPPPPPPPPLPPSPPPQEPQPLSRSFLRLPIPWSYPPWCQRPTASPGTTPSSSATTPATAITTTTRISPMEARQARLLPRHPHHRPRTPGPHRR